MILITGASGFIGEALIRKIIANDIYKNVKAVYRNNNNKSIIEGVDPVFFTEPFNLVDWYDSLVGVKVVIHCAALAPVLNEFANFSLDDYRRVNVDGTMNLAQQAAKSGVKRFVFISTIKVNGEYTSFGKPFTADDKPAPSDAYGISKLEAEIKLFELSKLTSMEIVIIRPPLVYGNGVKGNFKSLIKILKLGIPFPLLGVKNARSMVALDNLLHLLIICINHPNAVGNIFLVSDGNDLSTPELFYNLGKALNVNVFLFNFPVTLLNYLSIILGKHAMFKRLSYSLQVDITKTIRLLDWEPIISVNEGLKKVVE
jgi:nucleoside-diphosphate-sugar epimerase